MRARAQRAAMVRRATSTSVPSWQPVGPPQVSTSPFGLVTGRITSIAADPSDPTGNTVYVGSTGGGVWKSTSANGNSSSVTFTPLTDTLSAFSSATLTSLSIGAVSVQPGGTGVILAGTGDPNDATDSWYGAGLLRSTDGGNTWALISHATPGASGFVPNFTANAFAGFAWSTSNPGLVVAAISRSEYSATLGLVNQLGLLGLYYSLDAGASWQLATIQDGTTVIQSSTATVTTGNAATSVVWNPVRRRFYAAIRNHGYYESSDGITFTRLLSQPGTNLTMALCPSHPGDVGSPSCPIFRGVLAVQPVTGDMFALSVDQNNLDQGLWQDVCNASSGSCGSGTVQFGTRISDSSLDAVSGDGTISDGSYNLTLAAVPFRQDTLLFAGTTDIWRCSLANSCSWRNTTNAQTCASGRVFAAQHAIDASFGSGGLIYFGNDGGLWRTQDAVSQTAAPCSTDDATHFQNLNGGIGSLAEVEDFSNDPGDASTWLAALGTLGTAAPASSGSAWNQVLNGEGNFVAIDPSASQNWYATSEFGVGINACNQGTSCTIAGFGSVGIGEAQVDNDVQLIPAPWVLDPQDSSQLILGTCRVWRGPVTGAGWSTSSLLSNSLDGQTNPFCDGNAEIRSLAAGPNTATSSGSTEQLYAGMAGSQDGGGLIPGHVFTAAVSSANSATTTSWIDISLSPVVNDTSVDAQFNPGGFDVSSLYADPHDPTGKTVYATVQGYYFAPQPSEPIVYRSTDAGAHWVDISANLPLGPANSIVVDPNDPRVVYVALDTGVYYTNDISNCGQPNQPCWNIFGTGLPNAPVTRLRTFNSGGTQLLRAATYGRGIWQISLATAGTPLTTISVVPASLTFSDEPVQTVSSPQTVTVTNTGSTALSISAVSASADFIETDTCVGQSIPTQSFCRIAVTFDPSQTGSVTGTLIIYGNFASGDSIVNLAGTGLAPASVTLNPPALTFPATTIGSVSAAQIITINNNGGSPAAMQAETVSGDFSIAGNTCGNTLAANTSCAVSIIFQPTASGSRAGSLSVIDSSGTQTAMLSGTGQSAATDTLSATSLTFPAQTVGTTSPSQQVTLTNNGDQSLTQIAATISGPFTLINNCGASLQGHSSCALLIAFAPSTTGSATGLLTFEDEYGTKLLLLSGTGVAPPGISATPASIAFGSLAVGSTSAAQILTVTNNSGSAASGLAASITPGVFAIASNNCPPALAVGSACQIGITFSPNSTGSASGVLTLSAANLPTNITVTLSGAGEDFSLGLSGSSSAVLTSGQSASFTLQLSGAAGATGTVALTCNGAPQNATCSLNPASLTLTGANSSSATLSIVTGVQTTAALTSPRFTAFRLPVLALFVPALWMGLRTRRARGLWLRLLFTALLIPSACSVGSGGGSGGSGGSGGGGGTGGGGGGTQQYPTPPGTYTITVTGTMANITHTTWVTLTVQ